MNIFALVLGLVALIVALTALFYAVSKHDDNLKDVLCSLRDVLKGLLSDKDVQEWLFHRLDEWSNRAYHAVQQKYHLGEITAEECKDVALDLVRDFALAEGIILEEKHLVIASELIEVECDAMGHAAPEAGKELQA